MINAIRTAKKCHEFLFDFDLVLKICLLQSNVKFDSSICKKIQKMEKVTIENSSSSAPGIFQFYPRNNSYVMPGVYDVPIEDTNWVLTASFIIFTMQTGFGMLESGCVSAKNEVNIMLKNVVDVVLGGLTYWMFGFGMSFGRGELTNSFIALGDFFLDPGVDDPLMGQIFTAFLFQLSFATTASSIPLNPTRRVFSLNLFP